MKRAAAPRPPAIRWFAALFVAQALIGFAYQITNLELVQEQLASATGAAPSRDTAIVVANARLTIALIPVVLVWFFASRLARWLVLVLALARLVMLPGDLTSFSEGDARFWPWLAELTLVLGGAILLFTPSAARWFSRKAPVRAG